MSFIYHFAYLMSAHFSFSVSLACGILPCIDFSSTDGNIEGVETLH